MRRSLALGPDERPAKDSAGRYHYRFDVAAIRRYALGTSYMDIVAHVVDQLARPDFGRRPRLVIDGTGVGVAVVELFRSALRPLAGRVECYAVTITAGRAASPVARYDWHVAKIQLVGAIRAALESRRLKVPPGLEHADTLRRELQDFKVKITGAANETFSAREGAHDDIVLATAMLIYMGTRPWLQMRVDPADEYDPLRAVERAAMTQEARAIELAEYDAVLLERGRTNARIEAREREIERLREEDPFHPLLWPEGFDGA